MQRLWDGVELGLFQQHTDMMEEWRRGLSMRGGDLGSRTTEATGRSGEPFSKSNEKPCEGFKIREGYDLISLLVQSLCLPANDGLGGAGSSRKTC